MRVLPVAGVVAACLVLAGCTGSPPEGSSPVSGTPPQAPASSSASATPDSQMPSGIPSPLPSVPPAPPRPRGAGVAYPQTDVPADASPLSGRPGGLGKRLLVVKIDNTPSAQPQAGLRSADLIYVEQVEGYLTRLMAVFGTDMPREVGPVRSARVNDIDLLAPLGKVAFAYSGAQTKLLPLLKKANLVDLAAEGGSPGWHRDFWRPVGFINLIGGPKALLGAAGQSATAQGIGWEFVVAPPPGGLPARSFSADWGASRMGFRWDWHRRAWVVYADGARTRATEGGPQLASTVVVQRVRQTDSGFGDRYGGRTPLIHAVGSGEALVFRDGKSWKARWERPDEASPTRYLLPDGTVMPFAPGQTWVLLLPVTGRLSRG